MKIIRAGYTKYLNMFKTFVLTCRSCTYQKNTVRMDCHCRCHCQNDQEWSPVQTRMVNSSSFGSRFGTVRLEHHSLTPCFNFRNDLFMNSQILQFIYHSIWNIFNFKIYNFEDIFYVFLVGRQNMYMNTLLYCHFAYKIIAHHFLPNKVSPLPPTIL